MAECSKCGDCCELIALTVSKKDVRSSGVAVGEKDFILKNWKRIGVGASKKQGLNPDLINLNLSLKRKVYYYTCDKFNTGTRECNAHEERPEVCSGFPWYGKPPNGAYRITPWKRCSFWHDVPQEQWVKGVIPLPMP